VEHPASSKATWTVTGGVLARREKNQPSTILRISPASDTRCQVSHVKLLWALAIRKSYYLTTPTHSFITLRL
jgi:hypothetical protein